MQLTGDDAWVHHHLCTGPQWKKLKRLGVAVSGGGDSMALLHLLAHCAAEHGVILMAATVDHGLRAEAAEEAEFVGKTCAGLGVPHDILRWEGWDGSGNLQAHARAARYRLLAEWASRNRLDSVALGHTQNDQAETFLMRLAREAGVDGLAAMERAFSRDGAQFWRPALMLERAELRGFLTRHGLDWREDPSNEDEGFDRVKARRALAALEPLGIEAHTLAGVAVNMAVARTALRQTAFDAANAIGRIEAGDVVLERTAYLALPWEFQRRLLSAALSWVSGSDFGPRRDGLVELDIAILRCQTHTLNGCLVTVQGDSLRIAREPNAVKDSVAEPGALWDGRWIVTGRAGQGDSIRALGEAVKDAPDWRATGLPRSSLMAAPAVFRGDELIAAPLAGLENGWSAELHPKRGDFFSSILSH